MERMTACRARLYGYVYKDSKGEMKERVYCIGVQDIW